MAEQYYYNKRIHNAPIRRRLDRRFVSWVMIAACIGAVIASGFVFSAKCHFEAVALGYLTQQQRTALDEQTERRRQLELERARALAPEELEQRARRVGLRNPEPLVPQAESAANGGRPAAATSNGAAASARRAPKSDPADADTVRVSDPAADPSAPATRPAAQPAATDSTGLRKATQY